MAEAVKGDGGEAALGDEVRQGGGQRVRVPGVARGVQHQVVVRSAWDARPLPALQEASEETQQVVQGYDGQGAGAVVGFWGLFHHPVAHRRSGTPHGHKAAV